MPSPESSKARIVIVEDHPIFRERLAQIIHREPDMAVTGEADHATRALEVIRETNPDLVMVDLTLRGSDGLELIGNMKALGIKAPTLVLSMHPEQLYAERAIQSGARGYITKDQDASRVIEAIRQVLGGGIHVSGTLLNRLVEKFSGADQESGRLGTDRLTDRELEIFGLFGLGRTTREIAAQLSISENTVCTYRSRMKEKLDVRNFNELYAMAARWVRESAS